MKVGDIFEKNGKRYLVLAPLGGNNFSLKELKGDEPKQEELPVLEEVVEEPPVIAEKKRGRRKKG